MNRITNLLVLLIVTSFILPATAIMYVSGSPENNAAPPSEFTENNAAPPSEFTENNAAPPSEFTENNTAPPSEFTENNTAPPSEFTENNTAPPSGFREGNNTGNAQGEDLVNSILTVHNQERAEVGVPPLTWSDKLAASAQTWADQMEATGEFAHSTCCGAFRDYGENIAGIYDTTSIAAIADGQARWVAEKSDPGYFGGPFQLIGPNGAPGHYTQMVWRTTTEVGCATASQSGLQYAVLVCQYTPPGNIFGQPAY